jgi:hypothetical protein
MENKNLRNFMVKRSIVLLLFIVVVLVFFGLDFVGKELGKKSYISKEVPLSFNYTGGYLLDEKWQGSGERGWYQVTLIEDTKENRDLLSGKVTEPRDGPTAISVSVFPNTLDGYTTERFVKETNYSNWKLSPDGVLQETGVAGEPGLTYRFDGLYPGEAVVVARPEYVYMFSVAYLNESDEIRRDFKNLLETVSFEGGKGEVKTLYTFKDFANVESFAGTPAPVQFASWKEAINFKTALSEGAKNGPNLAGHFTVISWGCGTSCQSSAIVNAKDGTIVAFGIPSTVGLGYSKESRLLIVNPKERVLAEQNLLPEGLETDYYELKGDALVYLNSEQKEEVCIQVLAEAKNPATGEVKTFPTPCHVPIGWVKNEVSGGENNSLILSLNQTKTSGDLRLTLTNIEDHRCPANVDCFWPGEVKATLVAEKGTVKKTLAVRTNTEGEVLESYRIKITDVAPEPGPAGSSPDKKEYKIEFLITKE